MKASFILLVLPLAGTAFANAIGERTNSNSNSCNANNCLRGVRGKNGKPPLSSKVQDCSSFMGITVTPAPTVTTYTVTVNAPAGGYPKRQFPGDGPHTYSPSEVPAYATYCKDPLAYSSACSCAGIPQSTVTATTPTITAYATVTVT